MPSASASATLPGCGAAARLHNLTHFANSFSSALHGTGHPSRERNATVVADPPMSRSSSKPKRRQPQTGKVEGAWLLKALVAVVVVAIVCTYLTLCLVFSWSEWQLVLHPAQTSA